jgi:hypothetical protein
LAFLSGTALSAAVLALVAWNILRLADGQVTFSQLACVDVTDPCNWSSYRVLNDTRAPIILRECDDRCEHVNRRLGAIVVAPGTTTAGEEVRATVASRDWWEVRTRQGRLLGCLVLDGHLHKHDGDVVRVSSASPCSSGHATAPASA